MKNIMIIGNGFDLYHGLPTRYTDFLFFVKQWQRFEDLVDKSKEVDLSVDYGLLDEWKIKLGDQNKLTVDSIDGIALNYKRYNKEQFDIIKDIINHNTWISHFNMISNYGERWIDFENEIKRVLKELEQLFIVIKNNMNSKDNPLYNFDVDLKKILKLFCVGIDDVVWSQPGPIDNTFYSEYIAADAKRKTLDSALKNLNELIIVLRFYLNDIVFHIKHEQISEQIKALDVHHLVSFNYTDTFKRVYGDKKIADSIHRVHGSLVENDMVLGVGDQAFDDLDFVYFQKFFQRIQKRTGSFYRNWIPSFDRKTDLYDFNLFIMGHSLDPVDDSILLYFINSDYNLKTTIYYNNQPAYESLIINLIKLIGKEELIDRVADERIVFEHLKESVVGFCR